MNVKRLACSIISVAFACGIDSKSGGDGATTAGTDDPSASGNSATDDTEAQPVDCWQHFSEAACLAESEECQFISGGGSRFEDGVCSPLEGFGWCAPGEYGGSAAPSLWHDPATGRVFGLGFIPPFGPPGWEICAQIGICEDEPLAVEACQVCACDDIDEGDCETLLTEEDCTSLGAEVCGWQTIYAFPNTDGECPSVEPQSRCIAMQYQGDGCGWADPTPYPECDDWEGPTVYYRFAPGGTIELTTACEYQPSGEWLTCWDVAEREPDECRCLCSP